MMKKLPLRRRSRAGFSLIELMVAMAILMIIITICAQIFQQARVAWAAGQDIVDMDMTGRAVVDCIAQELGQAVETNVMAVSANSITFVKLGKAQIGVPALQQVSFSFDGSSVSRNGTPICPGMSVRPGISSLVFFPTGSGMPDYVDIMASVGIQGSTITNQYQTRVYFPNRKRYELQ